MNSASYSHVAVRDTQVVTRDQEGELLLVYIPDDRHVVLDEAGRRVWEALASGTSSVDQLVADHAHRTQLAESVAAYQVISFLDELSLNPWTRSGLL
jgi:hypothetical protein